jgi:ABC-type sugar transport system substrate-binding protein
MIQTQTRQTRHTRFVLALSMFALTMTACGSSKSTSASSTAKPASPTSSAASANVAPTSAAPSKKFTIGVAQAGQSVPFLAVMNKAIEAEAAKLGMEAPVILDGNFDPAKQAANVETLVAKKVDAIIVISSSPTSVIPAIDKAKAANIPVFAVNAKLDAKAAIVTYVGASDATYGEEQAKLALKALPKGGKLAYVTGPAGDTPTVLRKQGWDNIMKSHPEFEIVASPTDNFKAEENRKVVQDLLAKFPKGSLDLIVAQGPQLYAGADFAKQQGRTDVLMIAGDYSQQVEAAIKDGSIYGTVNQDPQEQGRLGTQYAFSWLSGDKAKVPTPEYLTPLPAITKDNVAASPSAWTS